jgi:hypothetical protein
MLFVGRWGFPTHHWSRTEEAPAKGMSPVRPVGASSYLLCDLSPAYAGLLFCPTGLGSPRSAPSPVHLFVRGLAGTRPDPTSAALANRSTGEQAGAAFCNAHLFPSRSACQSGRGHARPDVLGLMQLAPPSPDDDQGRPEFPGIRSRRIRTGSRRLGEHPESVPGAHP